MTGQLLWLNQEEPLQKHTRVRLFFQNNRELRFVDQRTFGQMWWVPPSEHQKASSQDSRNSDPTHFLLTFLSST
jgi:formamidopyrimidine-DNA glycosylase